MMHMHATDSVQEYSEGRGKKGLIFSFCVIEMNFLCALYFTPVYEIPCFMKAFKFVTLPPEMSCIDTWSQYRMR